MNREELKEVLTQLTQNAMLKIFAKNRETIAGTPASRRRTRPKFVIKYGPPASGKGSAAVTASIEQLGDKINTYVNINVDDIVESTNLFRRHSRLLLNKLVANKGINATQPGAVNAIVNMLNHLPTAEVEQFSKVYTNIRFGRNANNHNIGFKMDRLLESALAAGRNITFETTGDRSFPSWIFSTFEKLFEKKHYEVAVVFPIVEFDEVWRRYRSRPAQSYVRGGGFRFGSTKDGLRGVYRRSYQHMYDVLGRPESKWIDRIILLVPSDPKNSRKMRRITLFPKQLSGRRQYPILRELIKPYINNSRNQ